jgi:threonine-phosphate decarboxylase
MGEQTHIDDYGDDHGGNVHEAARRWSILASQVVDFSANINPMGPPKSIASLPQAEWSGIVSYPDTGAFTATVAAKLGVSAEGIVVGAGSAALLFAAINAIGAKKPLLLEPAFAEYRRAIRATGAEPDVHALREADRFLPDFERLGDALRKSRNDLIVLNNPHNPSGAVYPSKDVAGLVSAAVASGAFLIIDEAFVDYAPQESVLRTTGPQPGVILIRSVTKFYALPGLRVGYAVCDGPLAAKVRNQIPAWPVSNVALWAARNAVADLVYEEEARSLNATARREFQDALAAIGVTVFPSAANFLLIKMEGRRGSDLALWLERHHILIRQCGSFAGLGDEFVRLAVRDSADNLRLVRLIDAWCGQTRDK